MVSLQIKAVIALVRFLIILGLFLFLSAWTLHYWQAWIYLIIYSIAGAILTSYFLKKDPRLIEGRLRAGPLTEKENSQKFIVAILCILGVSTLIISGFDNRYQWSNVPVLLTLVSDIFLIITFFIFFLVSKENSYASGIIEMNEDQKVISTGPYKIVRHPMYASAILMFMITPTALGSYWALIAAFLFCLMIVVRLLDEEAFLKKNFAGYLNYCGQTKYRLIPKIW